MFTYLACLGAGAALGLAVRGPGVRRAQRALLPAAVLLLLFFMGVGIGKDPDLVHKIGSFGASALWVAVGSVGGSLVAVVVLFRALGARP